MRCKRETGIRWDVVRTCNAILIGSVVDMESVFSTTVSGVVVEFEERVKARDKRPGVRRTSGVDRSCNPSK